MSWIDDVAERSARGLARRVSRRSWLAFLGTALVGTAGIPLLPMARAAHGGAAPGGAPDGGDASSCDYWRYCAIDGFLCSCCGGSETACPPGTEMSPITWIGTCRNPVDGNAYVISYNDCCGKTACGQCFCNRNEGDRPPYRPDKANDINWCLAHGGGLYHCSTAIVVGLAPD